MSIKTKKNTLIKTLIGSGLLLSTVGLSFALTSCSKKSNTPTNPNKPNNHSTSYLFNFKPIFLGNDGKEDASEANLILESEVKKILSEKLDVEKGYNESFFDELDSSFEDNVFAIKKNNPSKDDEDITSTLGDTDIYYLNIDNVEKIINFDIDDKILSKCSKIDDVKKYISFSFFSKGSITTKDGKEEHVFFLDENNGNLVPTFYGEKDKDGNDMKITKDEDVSKIKKVKFSFSIGSFATLGTNDANHPCGFLVKFKPIVGDENAIKTVVVKFTNSKEYKYFDPEFYENFDKIVNDMTNDYFFSIGKVGNDDSIKFFNKKISEKIVDENEQTDMKNVLNKLNSGEIEEEVLPKIPNFEKCLKSHFSLTLDVEKSKTYKTMCFDLSSLPETIDGEKLECVLCFGKQIDKKYKEEGVMDVSYLNKDDTYVNAIIGDGTYDIPIDVKNEKIVVKILITQLGIEFISKDVEISLTSTSSGAVPASLLK